MKNAKCGNCANYIDNRCEVPVKISYKTGSPLPAWDDCDYFKQK